VTSQAGSAPIATCMVIVGASLAGLRAAERARADGFEGEVVLIGDEPCLPYDRPPLSKAYLEGSVDDTTFRGEVTLNDDLRLDLRLGVRAVGLDTARRLVLTDDGPTAFTHLIVATGSSARTIDGIGRLAGVHVLRTQADAVQVRNALNDASRVVVIGGGFIGSEIASVCGKRGARVTIVEAAEVPLQRAVGIVGAALMNLHRKHGVEVLTGTSVAGLEGDTVVTGVRLQDGRLVDADLVVVGIGSSPATGWLEGSGVELHPIDRGVVCDQYLATNVPGIWAAGDVAHWHNATYDKVMRLENWTSAAQQGAHAARNALSEQPVAYETVPYYWSDWREDRIQFVGVPDADNVQVGAGDIDSGRAVILYSSKGRLVGALTLNEPRQIMKLRGLITAGATTADAVELVLSIQAKSALAVK
jgi:NADPH-dependent 2,4-dienoyl-CoA reductase/sulfur reductase-like enzyme